MLNTRVARQSAEHLPESASGSEGTEFLFQKAGEGGIEFKRPSSPARISQACYQANCICASHKGS
jgi:hypothetical protein